jgi:hypothetical protein
MGPAAHASRRSLRSLLSMRSSLGQHSMKASTRRFWPLAGAAHVRMTWINDPQEIHDLEKAGPLCHRNVEPTGGVP